MAKYKVGDRVIVRTDLDEDTTLYWMDDKADFWYGTEAMLPFAGKVVTIKELQKTHDGKVIWYLCEGFDDNDDYWTDEMFVGLAEEEAPKEFKVGDRVMCIKPVGTKGVMNCNGTIRYIGGESYVVEFDEDVGGHEGNCSGYKGKNGYHWWVCKENLRLIEPIPSPIPTPTPEPTPEKVLTPLIEKVDNYAHSCWYCRKGGLVDLYLAGAMGICPNCKRVCNATNALPKAHTPSKPCKKENKPLTTEELKALPDGTRVFTVGLTDSGLTTWRVKKNKLLYREHKQTYVSITTNGETYNAYLEEPERP